MAPTVTFVLPVKGGSGGAHSVVQEVNALRNLGIATSIRVLVSCLWIKMFPIRPERSFADWVSNRFGRMLFRIFFETYTEKVWGIPCNRIGAQWAAQRIKGLSLKTAVISMLGPARFKSREGGRSALSLPSAAPA